MVFTCRLFHTLSMDMQLGAHHNEIASRPEVHARCARAASDRTDVIARSCLRLAQPSPELVCLALTKAAAAEKDARLSVTHLLISTGRNLTHCIVRLQENRRE